MHLFDAEAGAMLPFLKKIREPVEHRKPLQHTDVVVRASHAKKKKCQIDKSCDATASSMTMHTPT